MVVYFEKGKILNRNPAKHNKAILVSDRYRRLYKTEKDQKVFLTKKRETIARRFRNFNASSIKKVNKDDNFFNRNFKVDEAVFPFRKSQYDIHGNIKDDLISYL